MLPIVMAGVWLLSHLVPRRQHFTERRGAAVNAVVALPVTDARGFVSHAVSLTSTTGLAVDFRVLRPGAVTGPLPLVVLLGGHRTGRDAIDVLGDPGPIVVAALDYPYHGPERLRGVGQSVAAIPEIQRALLDTPVAVSVALDWLLRQPWVNPSQVELMGVSLGVPFAAVAGAIDRRFRRVWLVHGAASNRAWIANRLESRISNSVVRHSAAGLVHLLAHGASFKTDYWVARVAPRPVVIVGAKGDEQMSATEVERLFAAARLPKELLWSEGGHVRTDRHDIIRQLLRMVRERIEQSKEL